MKESSFIEQNKNKWKRFEHRLTRPNENPDELAQLFIEVTDDLSYAKTFFPHRSIRYYLNTLAQQVFYNIYKNRRIEWKKIFRFWVDDLPIVAYRSRKYLLFALCIFLLAVGIGVLSSYQDPDFCEVILGKQYMEMTKANIESGDPMAVYKGSKEMDMFLRITSNNIRVSILAFLMGLFFGIGTIGILLINGIMVGAIQYFFIEKGFGFISFTTIWLHGTLEISAIVIAGAAGMILGRGLILPGTYTRLQAFKISAKQGLKLLLGVLPIFIIAGFIEGFFTRHTEAPVVVKLSVIIGSLLFILGYFVFYPWYLARTGRIGKEEIEEISPVLNSTITLHRIKPVAILIVEGLQILKERMTHLFNPLLLLTFIHAGVVGFLYYFHHDSWSETLLGNKYMSILTSDGSAGFWLFMNNLIVISIFLRFLYKNFANYFQLEFKFNFSTWLVFLAIGLFMTGSMAISVLLFFLLLIFLLAYFLMAGMIRSNSIQYTANSLRDHIAAVFKNHHGKLMEIGLFAGLLLLLIVLAFNTGVFHLLKDIFSMNRGENNLIGGMIHLMFTDILTLFLIFIALTWSFNAWFLSYFSFREINEANKLKEEIDEVFG